MKAGLALAVGGGLAAAIPSLAAVGQSSPPGSPNLLLSPASIVDRGAAALVSVQLLCVPGDFLFGGGVSLSEKSGNGIASGSASVPSVTCDGLLHTVQVLVNATAKPFVKGTASGQLSVFDNNLGNATDARSITLTK